MTAGVADVKATVVAQLPDAVALMIHGDAGSIVERLLARPPMTLGAPAGEDHDETPDSTGEADRKTSWDRVRALSQMEKILLAVRADRAERAVLVAIGYRPR